MGRRRQKGREVHGILLLDKPAGITSNDLLQQIKRLFTARKAGHTGSLDKPATGLLPLCLGEATKFSAFLLDADKTYLATCKLGEKTTTADASGEPLEQKPVPALTAAKVEKVLSRFRGEISQVPPMHSALKHHGQRLYRLAHQGKEVERTPRSVMIHHLSVEAIREGEIDIRVSCSKGTYIRTLVEDIGDSFGCGAHVLSLRRIAVNDFYITDAYTPEQLQTVAEEGTAELDATLLPMDRILSGLPPVELNDSLSYYLCQGQAVQVPNAPTAGEVRLYHQENFLGIGEILDDGRVAPRRLVSQ